MTRYALIAALCGLLGLGGWTSYLLWRNSNLNTKLDAARQTIAVRDQQLEQSQEAGRVLDAHLHRMRDERENLNAEFNRLRQTEGYHDPLSDFMRDAFDRM
ncbi:hypothetical protein DL239_20115 [Sedimentitalea sp. CY04]|uniref:Uncharacterized protein n=1 Tax=Parasedimentitalea denitrificans TaxID=2211118 RepID=A0ABX0WCT6_9RHOB|nr:hypothetical protein [Sedimentitalea sp. CY04]NIZ63276.1 hypothetical protein [Sedimentitalea sp. CY04]